MKNFDASLNSDPLPWLLEPDNPSIRFWALSDLLDLPLVDPQVVAAREDIARLPLVTELFANQHPDGHWGDDPGKPYTAAGTLGVLGVLYTLGVEPDERTTIACDSFLHYSQHIEGGFSLVKTRRSGIFPCTTGEHLPMLVYFGMQNDPRFQRAFSFVIADINSPEALDCGRYNHRDCLWGAIAVLKGLAVLPEAQRSPSSQAVIVKLAGELLNADYDFSGEHKRWLTFGVPRAWDLLSSLRVLAEHGFYKDQRFTPLFELFLNQQDEAGRFKCGSTSRTWPLEKRNRPSKWVTLDALRLLNSIGANNHEH